MNNLLMALKHPIAIIQIPRILPLLPSLEIPRSLITHTLRFIQGLLATAVTLLLIITTADVVEIILNFAAVNYISALDEVSRKIKIEKMS